MRGAFLFCDTGLVGWEQVSRLTGILSFDVESGGSKFGGITWSGCVPVADKYASYIDVLLRIHFSLHLHLS